MSQKKWLVAALTLGVTVAAGYLHTPETREAHAADHTDPPERATGGGDATDIGDLYAWHRGTGADQTLVTVLTFAGPTIPANDTGVYDKDALYTIYIDNDGDHVPNHRINARFGQNALGDWGIQVVGMPGEAGPIVGPVEETIDGTSSKVWTGLRDDPFFFDLAGFTSTLQSETLAFDSSNDSFAGANITAIVFEIPMSAALSGGSSLNIWATTSKI